MLIVGCVLGEAAFQGRAVGTAEGLLATHRTLINSKGWSVCWGGGWRVGAGGTTAEAAQAQI